MANGLGTNEQSVREALRIAVGEPELVVVDARVLRLLMGDLAQLIILAPAPMRTVRTLFGQQRFLAVGEEPFVWDEDLLCP